MATQLVQDRRELERYKEFKGDLIAFGISLSLITGALLCSFLIPGLSEVHQTSIWQGAAVVFVGTVIAMGMHVKKFGCSVPQITKPETLTGADLC